jgi:hypothetical protein
MDRNGCTFSRRCIRSPINETKLAVSSVMDAFGRPVTAQELYQVWGESKSPSILDYHLCTLVKMRVVKLIVGSELRFGLVDVVDVEEGPSFPRRGAARADSSD